MGNSINFDPAADFYDATRTFPEGVDIQVAASLLADMTPKTSLLEVGIGTGRISRPLIEQGANVTGVDISARMLARLRNNLAEGSPEIRLAIADASMLPFIGEQFPAVVMVHILHLIPNWIDALAEARRMLVRGGCLYIGHQGSNGDTPAAQLRKQMNAIIQQSDPGYIRYGPQDFGRLSQIMVDMGASHVSWDAARWEGRYHVGEDIQSLENGIHSVTWRLSERVRQVVFSLLRDWAAVEFGGLDVEFTVPRHFVWDRYQWLG